MDPPLGWKYLNVDAGYRTISLTEPYPAMHTALERLTVCIKSTVQGLGLPHYLPRNPDSSTPPLLTHSFQTNKTHFSPIKAFLASSSFFDRNRKLLISKAPTKAKSQLIHRRLTKTKSIGIRQRSRSRQSGKQTGGWCLELRLSNQ